MLIALVGPDASGKSTLVEGITASLQGRVRVLSMHTGWPPPRPGTRLVRTCALAIRKGLRLVHSPRLAVPDEARFPHIHALLLLLTALDRRALVRRMTRKLDARTVLLSDRYPGRVPGAASGPSANPGPGALGRFLHRWELRVYTSIPAPNLVVRLNVPLEETVRRNAARREPKPEAMIRASHAAAALVRFEGVPELAVANTATVEESISLILQRVADLLHRPELAH